MGEGRGSAGNERLVSGIVLESVDKPQNLSDCQRIFIIRGHHGRYCFSHSERAGTQHPPGRGVRH